MMVEMFIAAAYGPIRWKFPFSGKISLKSAAIHLVPINKPVLNGIMTEGTGKLWSF